MHGYVFIKSKDGQCAKELRSLIQRKNTVIHLDKFMKAKYTYMIRIHYKSRIIKSISFPAAMYSFEIGLPRQNRRNKTDAFEQ